MSKKYLLKQHAKNAFRASIISKEFPTHNEQGELLITAEQQAKLMELDDEWRKIPDFNNVTFAEAEKLIKRSEDNAAKRKRMGYASTAQLRLIERKTGKVQDRMLTAKKAKEMIDELMKNKK